MILPNSRMSGARDKRAAAADQHDRLYAVVFLNSSTPARIPSGTPGLRALTGGLFTVRIPISPSLLV